MQSTFMKLTGRCPKCGNTEIAADAKAVDRRQSATEGEMSVATFGNPSAWIFKDQRQTTISAWVCLGCGFVEFYADAPDDLHAG
jgi:predicted nucleic-acid-binding Zn-ribbon protein